MLFQDNVKQVKQNNVFFLQEIPQCCFYVAQDPGVSKLQPSANLGLRSSNCLQLVAFSPGLLSVSRSRTSHRLTKTESKDRLKSFKGRRSNVFYLS